MGLINDSLDQAMLNEKIEELDIDFTMESIRDQLDNLLDNSTKQNYLKLFTKKFKNMNIDDTAILNERDAMYEEIIDSISNTFGIDIYKEDTQLYPLTKCLYKFFVVDLIDNILYFLETYIIDNKKELIGTLKRSNHIIHKQIEELDDDMSLIINNITEVIDIIRDSNIGFSEFLDTIDKHPDSPSSVSTMIEYNDLLIRSDDLELFGTIMSPVFEREEGFSYILTNLQLNICKNFTDQLDY